jgi:hypothetical protein
MRCPFFEESHEKDGLMARCYVLVVPLTPRLAVRNEHCTTSQHRSCLLYRGVDEALPLQINREVARALG